jgi:predicted HTH domain antitoxin
MADIISLELLEDELKAVVQAGKYRSQEEAVGHALEVLLVANPPLRLNTAVELYRRNRVTLSRAVEIAGLEVETFKTRLVEHGISIPVDGSPEEVSTGAELIHRLRQAP